MRMRIRSRTLTILAIMVVAAMGLVACGGEEEDTSDGGSTETEETDETDAETDEAGDGDVTAPEQTSSGYPDPDETLTFTVAFSAGGGNDIMSRLIADLIQQYGLWPGDVAVENVEGGSGAQGWGSVFANKGNPYNVSTTSGSIIATPLQADTGWEAVDFTPIGLFATDEVVLFVQGDSEYDTVEEFVEGAKNDPPVIAGVGAAQLDFLAPSAMADQLGFEFDYVSHDGTPEAVTTLTSGSADALMRVPGPVYGSIESGDLKPLAITGPSRLDALPDVPTFEEIGVELDATFVRGLVMPPGVDEEIQEWWVAAMQELVQTPEWQQYLDDNLLTENLVWGEDFRELLANVSDSFETALREEGVID